MNPPNQPHSSTASTPYGFQLLFKEDEKYYFQFNYDIGEPLLYSKSYSSEKSCMSGVQAVIRAAESEASSYELKKTKNGKHFFILKSGNHKPIGRSRTFDSQAELKEKIAILQDVDKNVPVHELASASRFAPQKKKVEKVRSRERVAAAEVQPKSAESMPRYKFSIIYYPDSDIWTVKNDFSGSSIKLKDWNSQKLEGFLRSELPAEHQSVLPVKPSSKVKSNVAPPTIKKDRARKGLTLQLRSATGGVINKLAGKGEIAAIELSPEVKEGFQDASLSAVVTARAIGNQQKTIVGTTQQLRIEEGNFKVPVSGTDGLKEGLYVFSANLQRGDIPEYYGECMVMLN